MKIIGLTGGIGTGKSTVAKFLAELGAIVINADQLGHEAFKPNTEAWREVVAAFGREILTPDGTIDREKLGKIVFSDLQARGRLNRIMHPRIYQTVKAKLEQYQKQAAKIVVLEAALLVEAGWMSMLDEVWVTTAPEATVLKRLKNRTGMSEAASLARIRAQLPAEERLKHADVIIDTDCTLSELKVKVTELWQKLQKNAS